MSRDEYIWIVRWGDFQHYKPERDRAPAWIKTYTKQLDDDRYTDLPPRARALLSDLRAAFARTSSKLRADTETLSKRLGCKVVSGDLERLNDAGFIEVVSRELLEHRLEQLYASRAPARSKEEEVEEETPLPPQDVGDDFFEDPTPIRGTRAAGTNPRAVKAKAAKNDQQQVHDCLLEAARDIAANWNGGGSDLFDDQLDALERNYRDKLGYLERDELWTDALNRPGKPADPDDELF